MSGSSKKRYYDERLNFRFEKAIIKRVNKLVKRAVDDEGFKKYENISHFIRAAIIRQIQNEEKNFKNSGRL